MIKLLVVDDSALMRKLLEGIFRAEGDFDIALARDAAEALSLVRTFAPDVVTLDIQMPGMDGLRCLEQIMLEAPRPVVMISSLTGEGAEATLEAMDLGAVDFAAKPAGTVSLEIDRLRPMLVQKVRNAAQVRIRQTVRLSQRIQHRLRKSEEARPPSAPRRHRPATAPGGRSPRGVVIIGTSTGGPAALDIVLPSLPADLSWPVLVAQHMPASFTGAFARRLDRQCALQVLEVTRPLPLEAGIIYIGRGDADLVVSARPAGRVVMSMPAQPGHLWHPSVERLVTSARAHFAAADVIGVLMTGMGHDGSIAMTALHRDGGYTIAEAEATAIVWGMPGELVRNGGAARVCPVEEIAAAILEAIRADAPR